MDAASESATERESAIEAVASDATTVERPPRDRGGVPITAVAVLRPTDGATAYGTVRFVREGPGAVRVTTQTFGLEPGAHAHHVHEFGDCRAGDAASAGGHLPFVETEGMDMEPDFVTGNLGEVVAPGTGQGVGSAYSDTTVALSAIGGIEGILGRSVVVHSGPNDPGQPPGGDAGPRVACGVIGLAAE